MQTLHCRFMGALVFAVLILCPLVSAKADESSAEEQALDRSASVETRVKAMVSLGRTSDERAAVPLLDILQNGLEEEGIRSAAARALATLGMPRPDILDAFESVYRDPGAGENLLYTLLLGFGTLRAAESLDLLTSALTSPNSMIRFKAAQALGMLGSAGAGPLQARLKLEKDRIVRAEIVRALGQSGASFSEEVLRSSLLNDPEPLVRWNALLALKNVKSLSPDTVKAVEAAQSDSSPMVRQTAEGMSP